MISRLITCLCLFALASMQAAPPSIGQWELRKRGAFGMESHGVTWADGEALVLDSGAPVALTLNADAVGLGAVENTALSTWAGTASVTTLGTITTGTWQGSVIAPAYLGTGGADSSKYLRGDGTWHEIDLSIYQETTGTLALGSFGGITGVLPVANGGTGASSLSAFALLANANTFAQDVTITTGVIKSPVANATGVEQMTFHAASEDADWPDNGSTFFSWITDLNSGSVEIMKLWAADATSWYLSGPFGIRPYSMGPNTAGGNLTFTDGTLYFYNPAATTADIGKTGYTLILAPDQDETRFGNTTDPQTVHVGRTYTSPTNHESIELGWSGNVAHIKPVAGSGGGTVRTVRYWLAETVWIGSGSGSPEGVETAGVGSIYTDSGSGSVYRKTSGSGNTGWVTP